ncbi:MAG: 50S ribosomal protein L23 [bacterium]
MKSLYQVIRRPIITEKSTSLKEESNKVSFEVHPEANKREIKAAIERIFKVHVVGVRTFNQTGKQKRVGRHRGYRSDWKKAIVTLKPEDRIEFFEGV